MNERLLRSAATVAACTLITRILGYLRDLALAYRMGSDPLVDAYLQAYRVVDLVVYLLAAGGATAALIPPMVRLRQERGDAAAWNLLSSVLRNTALVLLALVLSGELLAGPLARLVGPGFTPEMQAQTATLMRVMLPAALMLGCSAVAGAALNACGNFFWPPLAWGVLDLGILAGTLWPTTTPQHAISGVAGGVVVGSAAALAMQLLVLRGMGYRRTAAAPGAFAEVARAFLPAAAVLTCGYLYMEVAAVLVSGAGQGWVMALRYAARLINLPLGLVGTALSVALLPLLAQAAAEGNRTAYYRTLRRAALLALALCLPAALILGVFSAPIVSLLFEHGRFSAADALRLSDLLSRMTVGLPASALLLLYCQACYARRKLWQPLLALGLPLLPYALIFSLVLPAYGPVGLAWVLGTLPWVQLAIFQGMLKSLWT